MTTIDTPNCPKCGGVSTAPARQGMSLPYKCTQCSHSFGFLAAMSDLNALKNAYAGDASAVFANTNVRIIGKLTQP